jgi:hypothetical protein
VVSEVLIIDVISLENCRSYTNSKGKGKVVFGSRQMLSRLQDLSLTLLGKEINSIEMAKDLGVTLDVNLTYNHHINKTVSTCMSILGQINRVKHAFDKCTLITIIKDGPLEK